jgi:hypothetical protein
MPTGRHSGPRALHGCGSGKKARQALHDRWCTPLPGMANKGLSTTSLEQQLFSVGVNSLVFGISASVAASSFHGYIDRIFVLL